MRELSQGSSAPTSKACCGRTGWVAVYCSMGDSGGGRGRQGDGTELSLRADLPLVDGAAAVPSVRVDGAAREDVHVGVAAAGELEITMDAS